jgi:hypothetical protein
MMEASTMNIRCALSVLLVLLSAGCELVDTQTPTQKAVAAIDRAIFELNRNSTNWQDTLSNLETDLTNNAQSLMANEVTNLAQRGVAKAGTEIRCTPDFVGDRMREGLEDIKADLLHQPQSRKSPKFCDVVPEFVDLRVPENRRGVLSFYGWDMDVSSPVQVLLVDQDGSVQNESSKATYPTHYLLTVPIAGANGIQFKPSSDRLVFKFEGTALSSVTVLQAPQPIETLVVTAQSDPELHPIAEVTVPSGYTLIGGGCRSEWSKGGQLLTASYPEGNTWKCAAKAHGVREYAPLTAFAIGIPASLGLDIQVNVDTGASAGHPSSVAHVASGYEVIGGGCKVNWSGQGNLLVDSYPFPDGWYCGAKDHLYPDPSTVTAYVIGLRSDSYKVVQTTSQSGFAGQPSAAAIFSGDEKFAIMVGGGCDVQNVTPGNLLWASYPDLAGNGWFCASKDHIESSPTSITAYVLGIMPK